VDGEEDILAQVREASLRLVKSRGSYEPKS
jgi:hypothetical protein